MAERGLVIGARIVSGTIAAGVAALVVAAVALVPVPTHSAEPRSVTVEPAPADQVRVCPGALVRLGQASGENADLAFAIGGAAVDGAVVDGELERSRLASADDGADPSAAPEVLRVPAADGAVVGGAQLQDVDVPDFRGLAAASCAEPTGSAWLVGGATTVGRSTFLLLSNPTEVASQVSLEIHGEDGAVSAPGMTGIDVPAGAQRVLSLAGFAPGVASPVVHVTARGGRVVATLQQSIVRGLDSVGVEGVDAGADPAPSLVVPGVRILDAVGTTRASALADWQDIGPIVRVAVPGATGGIVTVRVVPEGEEGVGASFVIDVPAGGVTDVPLDAGGEEGDGSDPEEGEVGAHTRGLGDGLYTVFVEADVPVVAAVRASTAVGSGEEQSAVDLLSAPPSDVAWFAAAPALGGSAVLVVPDGPAPIVSIANPTSEDAEVELSPLRGTGGPVLVTVPAGTAASVAVAAGAYLLAGSESLSVAVSYADDGALASFVLAPPRPVAGPVVVRPD